MSRRCQDQCAARCCRYITVQIPAPKRQRDWDEISWWLAHHQISVYVEAQRWRLEMRTPCKYLTGDNCCSAYQVRPNVCRDHDTVECEFPYQPRHTLQFDSREDFDSWREKKRQQRRARRESTSA